MTSAGCGSICPHIIDIVFGAKIWEIAFLQFRILGQLLGQLLIGQSMTTSTPTAMLAIHLCLQQLYYLLLEP